MYPVEFINQVQAYSLIQRTGNNRRILKITQGNLYFLSFMDDSIKQFKKDGAHSTHGERGCLAKHFGQKITTDAALGLYIYIYIYIYICVCVCVCV